MVVVAPLGGGRARERAGRVCGTARNPGQSSCPDLLGVDDKCWAFRFPRQVFDRAVGDLTHHVSEISPSTNSVKRASVRKLFCII